MSDHEEKVTPESGEVTTKDRNQTIKPPAANGSSGEMGTNDRNQTINPAH
ncbi:hypothetical protein MMF93_14320 [Streptomyces tubbatahanensis]|uniref:Sigma-like protein n=1 Tax=Streptomyces tubbatahanensis TaxID=2923272 RepID=A0ABY3XTA6_9ACTN|nr:hypothetical protein [Streptomyces tubbatahanensis]UNS97536.1 hypothetical protein MMF93_14320 [Streptomyces tubbatahanensis]